MESLDFIKYAQKQHSAMLLQLDEIEGQDRNRANWETEIPKLILKYFSYIPAIRRNYIDETVKRSLENASYYIPEEMRLKMEDNEEKRTAIFDGKYGVKTRLQQAIEYTEKRSQTIGSSVKMNDYQKEVEKEICRLELIGLDNIMKKINTMYKKYIINFSVWKMSEIIKS